MKSCISTYSFWKMCYQTEWNLFKAIDKTKEMGADAVEFVLDDNPPDGMSLVEYACRLTEYAHEKGLETPIYTTGANFFQKDVKAEIERVKRHVDAASAAGLKLMRHDITAGFYDGYNGLKTFDKILPVVAPAIREVAEYAESKGVKTCSENHGRLAQDSDRMLAVFSAVDHPNYGYLCDIGNFGGVDEDSAKAVSKLLPLIVHVHAKDAFLRSGMLPAPGFGWNKTRGGDYRRATIYGQGNVPTFQCLTIIRESGYNGFVSLEYEGIEDVLTGIGEGLKNLKRDLTVLG